MHVFNHLLLELLIFVSHTHTHTHTHTYACTQTHIQTFLLVYLILASISNKKVIKSYHNKTYLYVQIHFEIVRKKIYICFSQVNNFILKKF